MVGLNEEIRSRVLTPRGIVNKKDLVPGDKVYEYETNELLEVQDIVKLGPVSVWRVEYTDGRTDVFPITSNVFTGDNIIPLAEALKRGCRNFTHVEQHQVDFKLGVQKKLFPDPYIAGALITYGNYDDPYINLPIDRDAANEEFAFKYGITYAEKVGKDCCYYTWNDSRPKDVPITWKEFFPEHTFYAKDRRIGDPIIPKEYKYASIKERTQMVTGIFDIGYDKYLNPDSVMINHKTEFRLREVQKLLWTLGIVSGITYDCTMRNGRTYILRVHRTKEGWPGFFYNIDSICQMIENDYLISKSPLFDLKVTKAVHVSTGYIYEIVLSKPNMLYLGANYLPRVSL